MLCRYSATWLVQYYREAKKAQSSPTLVIGLCQAVSALLWGFGLGRDNILNPLRHPGQHRSVRTLFSRRMRGGFVVTHHPNRLYIYIQVVQPYRKSSIRHGNVCATPVVLVYLHFCSALREATHIISWAPQLTKWHDLKVHYYVSGHERTVCLLEEPWEA